MASKPQREPDWTDPVGQLEGRMDENQHSEHYFGGPYTWQDTKNGSRMEFSSLNDLQSFLNWKSGRLEEQLEAAQAALRSIESMAGAAGAGETPAMPIAAKAREALYPAEMHPTDLAMLKKQLNEESSPVSGGVGALDAASPEGSSPARERL